LAQPDLSRRSGTEKLIKGGNFMTVYIIKGGVAAKGGEGKRDQN